MNRPYLHRSISVQSTSDRSIWLQPYGPSSSYLVITTCLTWSMVHGLDNWGHPQLVLIMQRTNWLFRALMNYQDSKYLSLFCNWRKLCNCRNYHYKNVWMFGHNCSCYILYTGGGACEGFDSIVHLVNTLTILYKNLRKVWKTLVLISLSFDFWAGNRQNSW